MNKLQRKAIWTEFKNTMSQYGFLVALNNLTFDIAYSKAKDETERDVICDRYVLRMNKISEMKEKFKRG